MKVKNILSCIPKYLPEELIENIAGSKNCKIERIISRNHKTAAGKWYNQGKNEFVLILKGNADLIFENDLVIEAFRD